MNVQYEIALNDLRKADIDTEGMCRISQVLEKAKEKYELTRGSAYIQLWKKTAIKNTLIEDLDEIPDEY